MGADFFDSNVLLYFASEDAGKVATADVLLANGGTISVQVLNEVASVARRKMQLAWPDVHDLLGELRRLLTVVPLTVDVHEKGLEIAERHGVALYDAMIVAAALIHGCDRLFSEDMQHGMILEGRLRIENPFRP